MDGSGRYEDVVSVVRQQTPHDGWKNVKFMVFDMPAQGRPFTERAEAMRHLAKTPYDAEAVVIGYKPGKGKNSGLMGAIKVRMDNGKEFYIGSGFTQQQRKNPPLIGSLVTYRYQGFTQAVIPRFAVFVRQRNE